MFVVNFPAFKLLTKEIYGDDLSLTDEGEKFLEITVVYLNVVPHPGTDFCPSCLSSVTQRTSERKRFYILAPRASAGPFVDVGVQTTQFY